jgi:glycosyltransferase involved in cell wall biosynthesis
MKICFLGRVAEALQGNTPGGAEMQISLLAKALVRDGCQVDVIDPPIAQSFRTGEGIDVWNIPQWSHGIRGLRLITHRLPGLVKALYEHPADVYYVRGRSFWFFVVAAVAKRLRGKFIVAVAHDSDLMQFRDRYRLFYRYDKGLWEWLSNYLLTEVFSPIVLRFADILFVQHEKQKQLAEQRGKRAILFRNILDNSLSVAEPRSMKRNYVVVGELSVRKGLPILLQIVTECPDEIFEIIGPPTDNEGVKAFDILKSLRNTVMWGRLDNAKTRELIAHSKALVNTSLVEGFPNTFLEAWCIGKPVISFNVDPDGVIAKYNLGVACSGDLQLMKKYITGNNFSYDPTVLKKYVAKFHSVAAAASKFRSYVTVD